MPFLGESDGSNALTDADLAECPYWSRVKHDPEAESRVLDASSIGLFGIEAHSIRRNEHSFGQSASIPPLLVDSPQKNRLILH